MRDSLKCNTSYRKYSLEIRHEARYAWRQFDRDSGAFASYAKFDVPNN